MTKDNLLVRQALPLAQKIILSSQRIRAFSSHFSHQTYVSFSGGKDSLVLLDLVRSLYPSTPAVYFDTGLEWPELREFVFTVPNLVVIKPRKTFKQVIETNGYPVVSKEIAQKIYEIRNSNSQKLIDKRPKGDNNGNGKLSDKWHFLLKAPFDISHRCCYVMKKAPAASYERITGNRPFVGLRADESSLRMTSYLKTGCNAFSGKRPMSLPIAFWTDEDIWAYIKQKNLSYPSIYDRGYRQTGCMFCMFGVFAEGSPNRFQKMAQTHPKQHSYCMKQLGIQEVMDYLGLPTV